MLKSLYLSAAGMLPKRRELEISANNLANLNTHGYKKDSVFYRHFLENVETEKNFKGAQNSVLHNTDVFTEFTQGSLEKTGNPLDVAIIGNGFFCIQQNAEQYLTRNGHFQIDAEGKLIDSNGNSVLTENGEIYLHGNNVSISESGQIMVNNKNIGQLKIVTYEALSTLKKAGNNYFSPSSESVEKPIEPKKIDLRQGFLEGSNVDPMQEMTKMIELYRAFELAQRKIKTEDANLEKINTIGRMT